MAEGKWITVPANKTRTGVPETRWQMPNGEIRLTQPGVMNWTLRDVANLNSANQWGYTPPGGAKASETKTNSSSKVKDSSGRDDQGADLNLGDDWNARANKRLQLASEGKLQTEISDSELPAAPDVPLSPSPAPAAAAVESRSSYTSEQKSSADQAFETGQAWLAGGQKGETPATIRAGSKEYMARPDIDAWARANPEAAKALQERTADREARIAANTPAARGPETQIKSERLRNALNDTAGMKSYMDRLRQNSADPKSSDGVGEHPKDYTAAMGDAGYGPKEGTYGEEGSGSATDPNSRAQPGRRTDGGGGGFAPGMGPPTIQKMNGESNRRSQQEQAWQQWSDSKGPLFAKDIEVPPFALGLGIDGSGDADNEVREFYTESVKERFPMMTQAQAREHYTKTGDASRAQPRFSPLSGDIDDETIRSAARARGAEIKGDVDMTRIPEPMDHLELGERFSNPTLSRAEAFRGFRDAQQGQFTKTGTGDGQISMQPTSGASPLKAVKTPLPYAQGNVHKRGDELVQLDLDTMTAKDFLTDYQAGVGRQMFGPNFQPLRANTVSMS